MFLEFFIVNYTEDYILHSVFDISRSMKMGALEISDPIEGIRTEIVHKDIYNQYASAQEYLDHKKMMINLDKGV